MQTNLVYLHIEKSAGTAQRQLLWGNYGRDRVAWSGFNTNPSRQREILRFLERPVLGGHFDYPVFRNVDRRCLFTAVVRDPVERAISLFYYIAHNAPGEQRNAWRRRGLNPESMARTLDECTRFRQTLCNAQCTRLSGDPTLEGALQRFESENFIVGTFDAVDEFNQRLGAMLNWRTTKMNIHNVSGRPGYQDEIRSEPGLIERLFDLVGEDKRLYEFVRDSGGVAHVPDEELFRESLSVQSECEPPTSRVPVPADAACKKPTQVIVYISRLSNEGLQELIDLGRVRLRVANRGSGAIPASGPGHYKLGYHWLDEQGKIVEEGLRTPLPHDLYPGESVEVDMRIRAPTDGTVSGRALRLSAIAINHYWQFAIDKSHGLLISH